MTTKRSASYSIEEDILLCHVYLDVSQNPIIGINQSGDMFWSRVKTEFDKSNIARTQERPRRSLQSRMSVLLTACSKLRGCINQIENKNSSGASDQDIVEQAKILLTQDANYSKGFIFDHVWPILRVIEKFANNQSTRVAASQSSRFGASQEEPRPDFSSPSLQDDSPPTSGMNSFDLNTSSEEGSFNINKRPMGVKKAKRKQQHDEQFKKILEQNERLIKTIAKGTSERNEIQRKKIEVQRLKEENKILFADLNSISDPACREYIRAQRAIIMSRGVQRNEYEETGEGSDTHYRPSHHQTYQTQGTGDSSHSQYRSSRYQNEQSVGDDDEGQNEISPSDARDLSNYGDFLSGTGSGNFFPKF